MSYKKLFSEFPPVTTQQWEEKIKKDLKGADYEKKLITKTIDGIKIRPYYREENLQNLEYLNQLPGQFPFTGSSKKNNNAFDIRQDIFVEDFTEANKKATDIINKGVNSVGFFLCHKENISYSDIEKLTENIDIENNTINFISGSLSLSVLTHFISFAEKNKLPETEIKASFDFDPLGHKTITGNSYKSENIEKDFEELKKMIEISEKFPKIKIINIHGIWFANAGTNTVEELAFTLSLAADTLDFAEKTSINIKNLTKKMQFTFGINSNYFIEIAKLRAARFLWANIVKPRTNDEKAGKIFICSETTSSNKTAYDPYVNQLRNTTEAMSAVIGSTNSLNVKPFDLPYKKPDNFSERIARNTGIILKEEAYFDKSVDPAAGSYFIENLTNDLIDKTWELFLKIEEKGGFHSALKQGFIQSEIKETVKKREINLATRKEILLGTNQYPNFNEQIKNDIDFNVYSWNFPVNSKTDTEPVKFYRAAKPFEELRLAVEKSGKQPTVFLLTYGNLAMRKARATFASNFFACAGYKIIDNLGFETPEKGAESALKTNADIVVICSSDDAYPEIVPKIYNILKNKAITAIAGYPKNHIEELKNAGIEYFIHIKSNVLETLQKFNKLILNS